MEGKHGNLDCKGQGESAKEPVLRSDRKAKLVEFQKIKGIVPGCLSMNEIHDEDRHKHQNASHHGVKKELDRGVHPPLWVSPDPNQEIHRNEHDFPENVKQDQIEGHQRPHHARFEEEEGNHELFDPGLDRAESA